MNKYVEYVKRKAAGLLPKRKEGQSEKDYQKQLLFRGAEAAVFVFAALAIVRGAMTSIPGSITVSNSVNGRELPIYCVETDKKQVALTFDAACAGS